MANAPLKKILNNDDNYSFSGRTYLLLAFLQIN
jgi:hypothetical protein